MPDRLQEIRARLGYVVEEHGINGWEQDWLEQARPGCMTDRFIAYAPNDIAWLLEEVYALRSALHKTRPMHERFPNGIYTGEGDDA